LKGAGSPVHAPEGWLSSAPNHGWIYRERVPPALVGLQASAFYAARYRHSDRAVWRARLAAGEMQRNGAVLREDKPLELGDRLAWHRPPWIEGAVPASWAVVCDDGDLLVIDKPSGLPVLPAGGWLEHTALRLLERRHARDPGGVPRPVHRLGRFSSGLLVGARRPATRAWLSACLRESTAAGLGPDPSLVPGLDHALEPIQGPVSPAGRQTKPPLATQPGWRARDGQALRLATLTTQADGPCRRLQRKESASSTTERDGSAIR
jgi:hypothetical protein